MQLTLICNNTLYGIVQVWFGLKVIEFNIKKTAKVKILPMTLFQALLKVL
jgi:hypothetical protein